MRTEQGRAQGGQLGFFLFRELFLRLLVQFTETLPLSILLRIKFLFARQDAARLDRNGLDVACLQPLADEIFYQRDRAFVREHPGDLAGKIFPQRARRRLPKQFLVRHGRPEKIRKPRGQCILIHQRIRLSAIRLDVFFAENKTRRRQHRDHPLRHTCLERFAGLLIDAFRQTGQAIGGVIVHRTAKGAAGEITKQFVCVGAAGRRRFGNIFWEKIAHNFLAAQHIPWPSARAP